MTYTPEQIQTVRDLLRAKWVSEGDCASCGWHALIHEHNITDSDIAEALIGDGVLRLVCQNEGGENHRGIAIHIK